MSPTTKKVYSTRTNKSPGSLRDNWKIIRTPCTAPPKNNEDPFQKKKEKKEEQGKISQVKIKKIITNGPLKEL